MKLKKSSFFSVNLLLMDIRHLENEIKSRHYEVKLCRFIRGLSRMVILRSKPRLVTLRSHITGNSGNKMNSCIFKNIQAQLARKNFSQVLLKKKDIIILLIIAIMYELFPINHISINKFLSI